MTHSRSIPTVLALAVTAGALTACIAALGPGAHVSQVPVVVLNFDPRTEGYRAPGIRQEMGWTDPRALADSLNAAAWELSFRRVMYRIVDWRDIHAFPPPERGAPYDLETYRECVENDRGCRDVAADIPAILDRYGVAALIDRGIAEEVWIFGGPDMGIEGAAMAGPGAYAIDRAHAEVPAAVRFPVLGFRYDRGAEPMLHTWCRRVEAALEHRMNSEPAWADVWQRFTATATEADTVGVGTCDTPPNARQAGVYDHPDTVPSTAPRWLVFPNPSDAVLQVSGATWGGPRHRRNFVRWWLFHVPHSDYPVESGPPADWWSLAFEPELDD